MVLDGRGSQLGELGDANGETTIVLPRDKKEMTLKAVIADGQR